MAEDDILVADGVIRKFAVRRGHDGESVSAEIQTEFAAHATHSVTQGMPHRIVVALSRKPLADLMAGRRIVIDPGHGGKDIGFRGPVNLLEKDCALQVGLDLDKLLKDAGALPILTRDTDCYLAPAMRIAAAPSSPELAVEIHMSGERDPLARSYHCYYAKGSEEAASLAEHIAAALNERMGTVFPAPHEMDTGHTSSFPLVRVEPVCLTYFADEANFRAPLFRRRIAQGIFNGIARYARSRGREGGGWSA